MVTFDETIVQATAEYWRLGRTNSHAAGQHFALTMAGHPALWTDEDCPQTEQEQRMQHVCAMLNVAARNFGQPNVFRLAAGLAEQLVKTDIAGIRSSDIQLPFQGLYLAVPRDSACRFYGNRISMVGIFSAPIEGVDPREAVALGDTLVVVVFSEGVPPQTPAIALFTLPFDENGVIDIASVMQRWADASTSDAAVVRVELSALVVGALLYITSPNPDVRPASGSNAARAWAEALSATRTRPKAPNMSKGRMLWDVGMSVQRLRPAVFDVLVRGHWRRQACGPQHSLRRMIWIQPHIRMPTGVPAEGHDYRVTQE